MPKFDDFWAAYPKRKGSNPRAPAEAKFAAAVKSGVDPHHIISSARVYEAELKEQNMLGSPYVCQAKTWLHQKRWLDYAPDPSLTNKNDEFMKSKGWSWNGERWIRGT